VGASVTDTRSTPLGTPNTAAFSGYAAPTLVINEVDYDIVGTENTEYVEILNISAAPVDLTNVALVLVNGNGNIEYLRVALAAASPLAAGEYLVVANTAVVVPASAKVIRFANAANNIQNGNPDGLALISTTGPRIIDALSYGGAMTAVTMTGFTGTRSLVEGTVLPVSVADSNTVVGSLARIPNGSDINDAATDWVFTTTLTPGVANQ
jgi:hypothetical protein